MKKIILSFIAAGLIILSSCKGGYTCPTYMQNNSDDQPVMVKQQVTEKDIKL